MIGSLGTDHPNAAILLVSLAEVKRVTRRYAEAGDLLKEALAIFERTEELANIAVTLYSLGMIHSEQGNPSAAEAVLRRALALTESTVGPEVPQMASFLTALAKARWAQGDSNEAEKLNLRALEIAERKLGTGHLTVAAILSDRAGILGSLNRKREAGKLRARAKAIAEAHAHDNATGLTVDVRTLAPQAR